MADKHKYHYPTWHMKKVMHGLSHKLLRVTC